MSNQDIANAFIAARGCIESGRHAYICHALQFSRQKGWKAAREIIQSRIGDDGPLENWLLDHLDIVATSEQMFFYRLRWLDKLIKEFSE